MANREREGRGEWELRRLGSGTGVVREAGEEKGGKREEIGGNYATMLNISQGGSQEIRVGRRECKVKEEGGFTLYRRSPTEPSPHPLLF